MSKSVAAFCLPRSLSRGTAGQLISAAHQLAAALRYLKFSRPVSHVYNPLAYAREPYEQYLRKFAAGSKRVIFLGMNPGPFGMVQTGVPFGQISAVRNWLEVEAPVGKPEREHPRRPVTGYDCPRNEVSGQRLWGLFAERFGGPEKFFLEHLVLNYCPLAFLELTARNRTPDKLRAGERSVLFEACDKHLRAAVAALDPEWLIGVGDFAFQRASAVFSDTDVKVGRILHPSPANPAANRNWGNIVTRQLMELGVWSSR